MPLFSTLFLWYSQNGTLEVAADAVEHLELEGMLVDLVLVDEVAHLVDDGLVVGGDAAEDALAVLWAGVRIGVGNHALHQVDVVGVDVGLGGEGDVGALFIGSLAEAKANSLP